MRLTGVLYKYTHTHTHRVGGREKYEPKKEKEKINIQKKSIEGITQKGCKHGQN